MSKNANRVRRLAASVQGGTDLIDFLTQGNSIKSLLGAAERGLPPVTALSGELIGKFGAKALQPTIVRQLIGLAVRAILERHGFTVVRRGARVKNDPVFSAGAIYAKSATSLTPETQLLKRLIDALTFEQLRWVAAYASGRLNLAHDGIGVEATGSFTEYEPK